MDYNNTYEREIDLKELMFAVLRRWRMLLVFSLALALVLGGYKAISAYQSNGQEYEEAQENYAKELETYNKSMEACQREIDNLTRDISSQEEYMENSILMNISPYDVWEAKAELFIRTEDRDGNQSDELTTTIMRAYQSVLTSSSLLSEIAEERGVDHRYLQELVTVTMGRDSYSGNDELFRIAGGGLIIRNWQNNFLTVQVRYKDEEGAKEILEGIINAGKKYQGQIQSSIGPHAIDEVSSTISSKIDFSLADQQNNERARLDRLTESLQTKNDELENAEEPKDSTLASPVLTGAKYGIIGGIMGVFLAAFLVSIVFVMSDKVYSSKELKYRFKIKILGTLPAGNKKTGKIDAWLSRLEGRAHDTDEAHEFGLISANICNYAGDVHSLLIAGNAKEETISRVASELAGRLPGINVVSGGNILHNADGLRKLPECGGLVLIEQCGESLYSQVALEIEKASDLQKTVVGCVVFE